MPENNLRFWTDGRPFEAYSTDSLEDIVDDLGASKWRPAVDGHGLNAKYLGTEVWLIEEIGYDHVCSPYLNPCPWDMEIIVHSNGNNRLIPVSTELDLSDLQEEADEEWLYVEDHNGKRCAILSDGHICRIQEAQFGDYRLAENEPGA